MINIAIVHGVANFYSGASFSLIVLAKEMKKTNRYNPIVYLLEKNSSLEKYLHDIGIDCVSIQFHDYWDAPIDQNLIKLFGKKMLGPINTVLKYNEVKHSLIDNNVKLVHINMLTRGGVAVIAEKIGIPVVWHMREFMEEDINVKFVNPKRQIKAINKSKHLIAVSKAVKRKFESILNPDISVIYNGINFNKKMVQKRRILNESELKVAIVGRIFEKKGQLDLIKALQINYLKYKIPYKLYIIGSVNSEKYKNKIERYIKDNTIQNRVKFVGQINNVMQYLQKIDILVMASSKEAFGRVTVEGMLSGCLVIGSDSGGTAELIQNKSNGLLFKAKDINDLASKLSFAYFNKSESRTIATNSQIIASKRYSSKTYADQVMAVYDEILKNYN